MYILPLAASVPKEVGSSGWGIRESPAPFHNQSVRIVNNFEPKPVRAAQSALYTYFTHQPVRSD